MNRTELNSQDARIFPGWYAPVIVSDGGRLVVRPMRTSAARPASRPSTTPSTPAPTTPAAIAWKGIGRACSASRTASWWPMPSMRMSTGTVWKLVSCATARTRRTSSSNSSRDRSRTCWSPARGHAGRRLARAGPVTSWARSTRPTPRRCGPSRPLRRARSRRRPACAAGQRRASPTGSAARRTAPPT